MYFSTDRELAAVGHAIRAAYLGEPEPEVTETHLAAILAEAERVTAAGARPAAAIPAGRFHFGGRRGLAFRLVAVVASAFIASAGLAIAGVRPPEPMGELFERIGFDVSGSDHGDAVHPRQSRGGGAHAGEEDSGAPGGRAENAVPRSAPGEGGAVAQSSNQGMDASSEGRETAEQAQSGATPPTEPGRSESHPTPPAAPPSHSESEMGGPASQSGPGVGGIPDKPVAQPPVEPEVGAPGQSGRGGSHPPGSGLAVAEQAGAPK